MKKLLHVLFLLFITVSLTACSSLMSKISAPFADKPHASPNDPRDYLNFRLPNGLQVLVVSDSESDRAAASINIAAGSFHEPDEWPGLAHFLEHMLFLGTKTFPESDAYQSFISQHGGSHNAFTAPRDTNYFFDIQADHLEPALHRLARFFIDPLFSPEYLEREINAVHSEWSGTLQDDARLRLTALRQALNPEHPASRFSAGNRETLDINNPAMRQAMLDFYQQFYITDRMSLVVFGSQSTRELRQMVEKHFAALNNLSGAPEPVWPELLTQNQTPALLEFKPLREQRQLQLYFPIPDPTADYRSKPDRYLAGLIGHEGEGSLLAALKQKGWATGLSSGSQMTTGTDALFGINIELTPSGDQHYQEIIALVFDHLQLIKEQGVEAWRFDEDAQLANNAFRFAEQGEARSLVTHLAMNLARYPAKEVLRVHYLYEQFDPERIHTLLDNMTPERLLAVRTSPDVKPDQKAQWLPAEYRLTRESFSLRDITLPTTTRLPEANAFIPSTLALKSGTQSSQPELLQQTQGIEVWHGLDRQFRVPRAQIYISLQNPEAATDLRSRLLSQLTARWLQDQLNASAYPARLAGLNYDIYTHNRGITLMLGGFNAEQPRLLSKMLQQLQQPDVDQQQFARLHQSMEQNLVNQRRDRLPQQLVRQLYLDTLHPGGWTVDQQLDVLEQLSSDDLQAFIPHFTSQLYIQLLAWGNITGQEAQALAEKLQQTLQPQLSAGDVDLLQVRQIPEGQWSEKLQLQHNDRALLFYIQGQDSSLEEEARMRLLAQLQSSAFFHELRTRQQLGYAVFSNHLPLLLQPGIFYFIQSPEHEPDYLAEAIEAFLREDQLRLEQLPATDFAQHQRSLTSQLLEADKHLGERAERFWREIGNQRRDFQHREQLAKTISQLTQQDMLDFYTQLMYRERGNYLLGTSPLKQGRLLPGQEARVSEWSLK